RALDGPGGSEPERGPHPLRRGVTGVADEGGDAEHPLRRLQQRVVVEVDRAALALADPGREQDGRHVAADVAAVGRGLAVLAVGVAAAVRALVEGDEDRGAAAAIPLRAQELRNPGAQPVVADGDRIRAARAGDLHVLALVRSDERVPGQPGAGDVVAQAVEVLVPARAVPGQAGVGY